MRRIGIITSGSDSPGQNAAIRAVVRMALQLGWEPWGVRQGFVGLMAGEIVALNSRSVSGIIGQGGTMLGSSRSDVLADAASVRESLRQINSAGLDALVVIGGDGSMLGAQALAAAGLCVVGLPATIENDVYGSDVAVGVDTALNTALEAMDRIRDTASSHQQAFLIETAGATCGYLALMAGIAGGAEMVCLPELPYSLGDVLRGVAAAYVRGKRHCIITMAEGASPHAQAVAAYLQERRAETGFDLRLTSLAYIQRGGPPLASDRALATQLGAAAGEVLQQGRAGVLVGVQDGQVVETPLAEVVAHHQELDPAYFELAAALAK